MSSPAVDKAIDDVAAAISKASESQTEPEGLKQLAEAAAALRYGPQGLSADYRYASEVDYHYTTHSSATKRSAPGFHGSEQGQPRITPGA